MRVGAWFVVGFLVAACGGARDTSGPPPGTVFHAIYGIDTLNTLIRFSNTAPGSITRSVDVSGLQSGEAILGIDFRPADGKLYALGSSSRLYTLDTLSGAATAVSVASFTPALVGTRFGFDVDPVADLLRCHSDVDQNLLLSPTTGAVTATQSPLGYETSDVNAGADPALVATAYTNSVRPAPAATVLYAIDAARDALVTLPTPSNGRIVTVGVLGVSTSGDAGLDIVGADGPAYATLTPPTGGPSRLYFLNLTTGRATLIGTVGSAVLRGIAVAR
jgi:uncharacterized protein DUF4394